MQAFHYRRHPASRVLSDRYQKISGLLAADSRRRIFISTKPKLFQGNCIYTCRLADTGRKCLKGMSPSCVSNALWPPQRARPTTLWSGVDHEYEELLKEETAEPREPPKEPNYHAYRAPFSHFPRTAGPWEGLSSVRSTEERRKIPCPRTYRAYRALFSHFPRTPVLKKASTASGAP
jgi:hypothetical protein